MSASTIRRPVLGREGLGGRPGQLGQQPVAAEVGSLPPRLGDDGPADPLTPVRRRDLHLDRGGLDVLGLRQVEPEPTDQTPVAAREEAWFSVPGQGWRSIPVCSTQPSGGSPGRSASSTARRRSYHSRMARLVVGGDSDEVERRRGGHRGRSRRQHGLALRDGEAHRLVDGDHVGVLVGVPGVHPARLRRLSEQPLQVGHLDQRAEPVAAVLLEDEGVPLARVRRVVPGRDDVGVGHQRAVRRRAGRRWRTRVRPWPSMTASRSRIRAASQCSGSRSRPPIGASVLIRAIRAA